MTASLVQPPQYGTDLGKHAITHTLAPLRRNPCRKGDRLGDWLGQQQRVDAPDATDAAAHRQDAGDRHAVALQAQQHLGLSLFR